MENFAAMAIPLYELTQKDVKFTWSRECQLAFDQLKTIIASEPILRQPNWETIFHVHVDASGIALGSILAHNLMAKWIFQYTLLAGDFPKRNKGIPLQKERHLGWCLVSKNLGIIYWAKCFIFMWIIRHYFT